MSRRRAEQEAGFVLHTYPYKETSLIVEVFSRRFGRVALLARGARRPRSAMRGVLLAFHPLRLGWTGVADLATLTGAEWAGASRSLSGVGLMCGFYMNELILRLLPREDPHEALYDFYAASVGRLAEASTPGPVLRAFEKRLLAELGYAPSFETDADNQPVEPDRLYTYEPDRGAVPARGAKAKSEAVVSGRALLDVARDEYTSPETREQARLLMRALIGHRLHGQTLHTRAILIELNQL